MKKWFGIGGLLVALVALAFSASSLAQNNMQPAYSLNFDASVRQGPDKGLSLKGKLTFNVDEDGTVTGKLTQKNGKVFKMSGQAYGRMVTMAFYVKDKGFIYGSGMFLEKLDGKFSGLRAGGTLSGPREGDLGDWEGYAGEGIPGHPGLACGFPGSVYDGQGGCVPGYYYRK